MWLLCIISCLIIQILISKHRYLYLFQFLIFLCCDHMQPCFCVYTYLYYICSLFVCLICQFSVLRGAFYNKLPSSKCSSYSWDCWKINVKQFLYFSLCYLLVKDLCVCVWVCICIMYVCVVMFSLCMSYGQKIS